MSISSLNNAWKGTKNLFSENRFVKGYHLLGTATEIGTSPLTSIINLIFGALSSFEAKPQKFDEIFLEEVKLGAKEFDLDQLGEYNEFFLFKLFRKGKGISFLKKQLKSDLPKAKYQENFKKYIQEDCCHPLKPFEKEILNHFIEDIYLLKFHPKSDNAVLEKMIQGVIDQSKVQFASKIIEMFAKPVDLENSFFSKDEVKSALTHKEKSELSDQFEAFIKEKINAKHENFDNSFIKVLSGKYAAFLLSDESLDKDKIQATVDFSQKLLSFFVMNKVKAFAKNFKSWVVNKGNERLNLDANTAKDFSKIPGLVPAVAFLGPAFMDVIEKFIQKQSYFKDTYPGTIEHLDNSEIQDETISEFCDLSAKLIVEVLKNEARFESRGKFDSLNVNFVRSGEKTSVPLVPLGEKKYIGLGETEFEDKLRVFIRVIAVDFLNTSQKIEGNLYSIFSSISKVICDFSDEMDTSSDSKPDPKQIAKKLIQLITPSEKGKGNNFLPFPLQKIVLDLLLGENILPHLVEKGIDRIFDPAILGSAVNAGISNINFTATERRNPFVPIKLKDAIKSRLKLFAKGKSFPVYKEVEFHYPENLKEEMEKLEVHLSKLIGKMLGLWQPDMLKNLQRISILDPSGNIINGKIHETLAKLAVRKFYQTMQNKFRKDKSDDDLKKEMSKIKLDLMKAIKKKGPGLNHDVQIALEKYLRVHIQLSTHSEKLATALQSRHLKLMDLPLEIVKLAANELLTPKIRQKIKKHDPEFKQKKLIKMVVPKLKPFFLTAVEFYFRGGKGSTLEARLKPIFEDKETKFIEIDSALYSSLMEDLKVAILDPRKNEFSAKKMLSMICKNINEEIYVPELMLQKTKESLAEILENDKGRLKGIPSLPKEINRLFRGKKRMEVQDVKKLIGMNRKGNVQSEIAKILLGPLSKKEGILDFVKESDLKTINPTYEVLMYRLQQRLAEAAKSLKWKVTEEGRVKSKVGSGDKNWFDYFHEADNVVLQKKLMYCLIREALEDTEYLEEASVKEKKIIREVAIERIKGLQHEMLRSIFYEFKALFFGIDSGIHRLTEKLFYPFIYLFDSYIEKIPKIGQLVTFKANASRLADLLSAVIYLALGLVFCVIKCIGYLFNTFWVLLGEFSKGREIKKKILDLIENKLPERMLDPKEIKRKKLNSLVWDYLGSHLLELLIKTKKDLRRKQETNKKVNRKLNKLFPSKLKA